MHHHLSPRMTKTTAADVSLGHRSIFLGRDVNTAFSLTLWSWLALESLAIRVHVIHYGEHFCMSRYAGERELHLYKVVFIYGQDIEEEPRSHYTAPVNVKKCE